MKEKVSVIIPVLNREHLIVRCLESIRKQQWNPIEVIIVDNGSTDNTCVRVTDWIETLDDQDKRKITAKLVVENEKGASNARNKGLEIASGDFIIFFDSDDMMHMNLIEKAMDTFNKNPDTDVVAWRCRIHLFDGKIKIPPSDKNNLWESHMIHSLLRPQGYMARREIFNKAGGWDKNLPGWNDWELGIRILLLSPNIIVIEDVLAEIYSQADSITGLRFSDKEGIWEKSIATALQNIKNSSISDIQKEKLEKIILYKKIILAVSYHKEKNEKASKRLRKETLSNLSPRDKILLNAVFYYTAAGFRGAWKLIRRFYITSFFS